MPLNDARHATKETVSCWFHMPGDQGSTVTQGMLLTWLRSELVFSDVIIYLPCMEMEGKTGDGRVTITGSPSLPLN